MLGLTEGAAPNELTQSYNSMMKKYRKDVKMTELIEEAYQEIVALRSIEVIETEVAAEAVVKAANYQKMPRRTRRPFRHGGLRSPLIMAKNMAQAVVSASQSPNQPEQDPGSPK